MYKNVIHLNVNTFSLIFVNKMNKARYEILISEIIDNIDSEMLNSAMSNERKDKRTDMVLMIIRDAINSSSLGIYNGVIYHFGGKIYEPIEGDDFGNMIYDVMRRIGVPMGDFSKIESFIRVCRRRVNTNKLEINNSIVVFRNCVYDIVKDKTFAFSKEFVQFNVVDYDYSKDAKSYIWRDFLNKVLPNRVYQLILQEYIGSLFIDRKTAKLETMMILKGNGSNGKSVVFETVVGVIGKDNVSNFGIEDLIGSGNEKKRNLATMNGKRLNYASETGNFTIDGGSGLLKALISGEPVEARAMYGDNFTAYDIPLIMINCNKMPNLRDFSHGMRRRIMIIPFDVEIPRALQNKELARELVDEYPAIFNWAIEGRKRFVENGYKLTECDYINDMIDEYQVMNSNVLEFMTSRKYLRENDTVIDAQPLWKSFNTLYSEYKKWCIYNNDISVSKREASNVLCEYGYKRRRTGSGVQFALFGEAAYAEEIKRKNEARVICDITDSEVERLKLNTRAKDEIRKKFALAFGWDRVALGFRELADYTGYNLPYTSELRSGRLDGTYKYYNNIYVFNLDLIDSMWRPLFEDRIRRAEERKQETKENKALMRAYTQLEIEQYFEELYLPNYDEE